jgi:Cu/Ag efflux protein CusF
MKHLIIAVAVVVLGLAALPAFAHGNNAHVRGVVTQVSAQSITVQLADNTTKTLALTAKTAFLRSGKPAAMTDLKVGDRVVVDVPKNSSQALEVQIGTAKTAPK